VDEILKAYEILGVQPGVSLRKLRWRYRALVRQRHLDVVERATRLQKINAAYRTALQYLVVDDAKPRIPGTRHSQLSVREQLAREEIAGIAAALQTNGPVDDLLRSLDPPIVVSFVMHYVEESAVHAFQLVLLIVGLIGALALAERFGVPRALSPLIYLVGIALFAVLRWRRIRARHEREPRLPTPWR
jgi:hypothetical protein